MGLALRSRLGGVAFVLAFALTLGASVAAESSAAVAPADAKKPSLSKALAALKVPPPWFAQTPVQWNTSRPWKDGRLEIRRLLAFGTQGRNRQAIKLTYLYRQKGDIGNGHEWPMYLFLGGETAWATRAYEEFLRKNPERNTHAYIDLMSCYRYFGLYAKAKATADLAMKNLPNDRWQVARQADVHDALGDLYAEMGDKKSARMHYAKAAGLYPKSKQPTGRHLLARRAAKVRAKIDLLDMGAIESGKLRDGKYTGDSLAYTGPLHVTVTVRGGRISNVAVKHTEKIHQNAPQIIPRRIVETQSLKVDAVTAATVTSQAIVNGTLRALRKAARK